MKKLLSIPTQQKNVRSTLVQAKRYLAQGFAKGTLARSRKGDDVNPRDLDVCEVCSVGAIQRATTNPQLRKAAIKRLESALAEMYDGGVLIEDWQDKLGINRSHVTRLFSQVIDQL